MPISWEFMIHLRNKMLCSLWKGGRFVCINMERDPRKNKWKWRMVYRESHMATKRGEIYTCQSTDTCIPSLDNFWPESPKKKKKNQKQSPLEGMTGRTRKRMSTLHYTHFCIWFYFLKLINFSEWPQNDYFVWATFSQVLLLIDQAVRCTVFILYCTSSARHKVRHRQAINICSMRQLMSW